MPSETSGERVGRSGARRQAVCPQREAVALRRPEAGLSARQYPRRGHRSVRAGDAGLVPSSEFYVRPHFRTFSDIWSSWTVLVGFAQAGPSRERVPEHLWSLQPRPAQRRRRGHRLEALGTPSPPLWGLLCCVCSFPNCVHFSAFQTLVTEHFLPPPGTAGGGRVVEGDRGRRSRAEARPGDQSPLPWSHQERDSRLQRGRAAGPASSQTLGCVWC